MYPIPWRRKKYVTRQCVETQQDFFLSLIIIKQKMCNAAIDVDPWSLYDVLDYFKTQKMCDDVVQRDPYFLQFVPDWFVAQEQPEIWHDDDDYCTDDEIIELYKRYEKRKARKASIKEELLPIVWHPDRVKNWCMSEDEKGLWK